MTPEQEKMVMDNLDLIPFIVGKYFGFHGKDWDEENKEIGLIGLIKGAKTYNPNKGIKESTYLATCIRNEINKGIYLKKMPKRDGKEYLILNNIIGDSEIEAIDLVRSDFDLEEYMIEKERMELLNKMLEYLGKINKKYEEILRLYFGINCEKMKIREIGEKLGLANGTISYYLDRGLKILRKRFEYEIRNEND